MKHFLLAALLFMGLGSCNKGGEAPARPTVMSAQVNGQAWQTVSAVAQVSYDRMYQPNRYVVFIEGGAAPDLTGLGIKSFDLVLNASYLPKVGRHYLNNSYAGPIGAPNQKVNYLSAGIQFELLDTSVYHAGAIDGFLDIVAVTDTHVEGTFEFTAATLLAPATGVPTQFTVEKGHLYAKLIGVAEPVAWEGVQ